MKTTITLIGCGNLGGAMLRGWLRNKVDASFIVLKPNELPADLNAANVTHVQTPDQAAPYLKKSEIVVLAVKPQIIEGITKSIAAFVPKNALVISVAAGRSLQSFENVFGKSQPIVRTIPNLGAQAGESITPAIANKNVGKDQHASAEKLLNAIGEVNWIKSEDLMHVAAAVTASGPGFLAYFMETLALAGVTNGLDEKTAEQYVRQMVIGTAASFKADKKLTSPQLRQNVTSPNGMTEAGLKIMRAKLPDLMQETINAAKKRSRELGKM
jgi:pyrroline-5-carboxylate reductase